MPKIQLSPADNRQLYSTLQSAFSTRELRTLIETSVPRIAGRLSEGIGIDHLVPEVVATANRDGELDVLLVAAAEDKPSRPDVRAVVLELSRRPGWTASYHRHELSAADLEHLTARGVPFVDVAPLARWMVGVERHVCQVRCGDGFGTGFLVGPDLVLTNHHVVADHLSGHANVHVRFDYCVSPAGQAPSEALPWTDLDPRWKIPSRPPSAADSAGGEPSDTELDYALLKLATNPGRGWIDLSTDAPLPPEDAPILIVQHPGQPPSGTLPQQPLKISFATPGFERANPGRTRVAYRPSTLPGSSGSPVFGPDYRAVALHHNRGQGYDPSAKISGNNRGIPLSTIRADLGSRPDSRGAGPAAVDRSAGVVTMEIVDEVRLDIEQDRLGQAAGRVLEAAHASGDPRLFERALSARGILDPAELLALAQELVAPRPSRAGGKPLVRLTKVDQSYGDHEVLNGVTLEVGAGEIVGIVGVNGSGKTTLMRALAGELAPTSGIVEWPAFGGRPDTGSPGSGIALVPQVLPGWRESVGDTLDWLVAVLGQGDKERRYIVAQLGLGPYLDDRWSTLSGGYRLRAALAAAIVARPRLLLLDEPFAGLDPASLRSVLVYLGYLVGRSDPMGIVVTTHHVMELESVATRVILLDDAKATVFKAALDGEVRRFEVTGPRDRVRWERFASVLGARIERQTGDTVVMTAGSEVDAAAITGLGRCWGIRMARVTEVTGSVVGLMLARAPE